MESLTRRLEAQVAARVRGVSIINPELRAVEGLTDAIRNIREVRVAALVHNTASYDPARQVTLSGTSQFNDYTNSDPIGVIKAALEGTLVFTPNTLVMGRQVWSKLGSHPKIVNAVKGNVTNAGIITREQFVELFSGEGVTRLLVGDAQYNTAKPGQAPTLARAWGKHIALLHLNPMASVEAGGITFGMTAEYGGKIAGRIVDQDVGLQGGVRIRTGERIKELIIARDVGYLVANAVA